MSSNENDYPGGSLFVMPDPETGEESSGMDNYSAIPSVPDFNAMFGNPNEPMSTEVERYMLQDSSYEHTAAHTTGQESMVDHSIAMAAPSASSIEPSAAQVAANVTNSAIEPTLTTPATLPHRTSPGETVQQLSAEWNNAVNNLPQDVPTMGRSRANSRRGASRQVTSARGGRRGRGRACTLESTRQLDADPLQRYPPFEHNPPPENRAGRTRERSREGREPPRYVPNEPTDESGDQQTTSSNNVATQHPMGDVDLRDEEPRMMIWVDAARFDLLLQVAYERRHETLSERAWRRIATGCHGGPFRNASWNAVRLEYSRMMRERFPGYGQDSPEADRRRMALDQVAEDQFVGVPTTVSPADLNHNTTDASTECPRNRNDGLRGRINPNRRSNRTNRSMSDNANASDASNVNANEHSINNNTSNDDGDAIANNNSNASASNNDNGNANANSNAEASNNGNADAHASNNGNHNVNPNSNANANSNGNNGETRAIAPNGLPYTYDVVL